MPSDLVPLRRNPESGFSLLEVLISLALAAAFLAVVLWILPSQSLRVQDRLDRLLATEFAYSVLEEYRITYPQMKERGEAGEWAWQVTEREVVSEDHETLEGLIRYVEITATVWHGVAREDAVSLTSLVARRRP